MRKSLYVKVKKYSEVEKEKLEQINKNQFVEYLVYLIKKYKEELMKK